MINNEMILAITANKAKFEEVQEYSKNLENFLDDPRNVLNPDYYDAKEHLGFCYDWLVQNEKGSVDNSTDKNPSSRSFPRKLLIDASELHKRVLSIVEESYTPDQLEGAILYLSRDVGCTSYELKQYYQSLKIQEDREEFLTSTKQEIDQIIRLEGRMLKIHDFIPPLLADEICIYANNLKVRPEACLTALLAGISVCNKIGTVLEIRPAQGFIQSPYLFAMLVAESGSMKSPILNTFSQKPLMPLQASFVDKYKAELAAYELAISEWDSMDEEDRSLSFPNGKPEIKDRPRVIHISEKTMEGMNNQFDRYPDQALLYCKDEIAGIFQGADKYRGGKGSEKTDIMSMYDGVGQPTLRAKEGLISNPDRVGLSIFGTIQPEVLEQFWSDVVDPDGQWSRYLYCYQAKSLKYLPVEQGGEESRLDGMLESVFKSVYKLPAVAYKLDRDGYACYKAFYDYLGKKGYEEVHPALSKAYSKALGQAARLILNLHIINEMVDSNVDYPREIVPLSTIRKGINLMEFYLEQRQLLTKRLCNSDSISPELISVIKASKKIGWVSSREIKRNIWKLRDTDPAEIRKWFQELSELGYGDLNGKGNRLKFKSK